MSYIARIASAVAIVGAVWSAAQAQDVVKIGQIEAQTGPNAIYGYMGSQGVPMAVDEINKAGGFKVGDKAYKIELISLDTRGDPKEATIQLKRLLEQEKAKFRFWSLPFERVCDGASLRQAIQRQVPAYGRCYPHARFRGSTRA